MIDRNGGHEFALVLHAYPNPQALVVGLVYLGDTPIISHSPLSSGRATLFMTSPDYREWTCLWMYMYKL